MADQTVRVRLEAAVQGFQRGMAQARQSTRDLQQGIRDNRAEMQTAGIALTAFGVAGAAAFRSVISSGAQFQASMNQVRAVSGATGSTFDRLQGQARELGATTRFSASEAAEGMGFLAMAGFEANEMMEALPGTLELAAAGNMDLATAADIASNVLTGYGMQAEDIGRVNDVMAATFTTSNTNLNQLGEAMKYVAPVAAAAGVEFEETSAAIGLMGNAGIQASMAGTSLRGAITRLLNPTGEAADILERLGVQAVQADGSLRPLHEIVEQLEVSGASTAEMMAIFGQRAGPAMAALVGQGADALRDQTTVALESAGTAAEIAGIQMEGVQGSLIELGSAAEGLKIALFEAGIDSWAEMSIDALTGVIRGLEGLPVPAQQAAVGMAGIATVASGLGGATLLLAPRIVSTADALKTLTGQTSAFRAVGVGLRATVFSPWALGLAAVATAAGAYFAKRQELARDAQNLRDMLGDEVNVIDDLVNGYEELSDASRRRFAEQMISEHEELVDILLTTGVTFDDLIDALLNKGGPAYDKVNAAIEANTERTAIQGQGMEITSGKGQELAGVMDHWAGVLAEATRQQELFNDSGDDGLEVIDSWEARLRAHEGGLTGAAVAAGDAAAAMEMFEDGVDGAAQEAEWASPRIRTIAEAFTTVGEEAMTAIEAIQEFEDRQRAISDPVFGARRAEEAHAEAQRDITRAYEDRTEAQRELDKVMKDGEATEEDRRRATRRLEDAKASIYRAYEREIDAAMDLDFALLTLFGSIEDGTTNMNEFDALVDRLVENFGLSDDAAQHMAETWQVAFERLKDHPDVIELNAQVDVRQAEADVQRLRDRTDREYLTLRAALSGADNMLESVEFELRDRWVEVRAQLAGADLHSELREVVDKADRDIEMRPYLAGVAEVEGDLRSLTGERWVEVRSLLSGAHVQETATGLQDLTADRYSMVRPELAAADVYTTRSGLQDLSADRWAIVRAQAAGAELRNTRVQLDDMASPRPASYRAMVDRDRYQVANRLLNELAANRTMTVSIRSQWASASDRERHVAANRMLNAPRMHTGGHVAGGGGTPGLAGDEVPIVAQRGEFVVRASQAERFGPLLEAINAGRMHTGGWVDGAAAVTAGGFGGDVDEVVSRLDRVDGSVSHLDGTVGHTAASLSDTVSQVGDVTAARIGEADASIVAATWTSASQVAETVHATSELLAGEVQSSADRSVDATYVTAGDTVAAVVEGTERTVSAIAELAGTVSAAVQAAAAAASNRSSGSDLTEEFIRMVERTTFSPQSLTSARKADVRFMASALNEQQMRNEMDRLESGKGLSRLGSLLWSGLPWQTNQHGTYIEYGTVSDRVWQMMLAEGFKGRPGDRMEALYLPRFHSGGLLGGDEVPFIGLSGERVLSRQQNAQFSRVMTALAGRPMSAIAPPTGTGPSGPTVNIDVAQLSASDLDRVMVAAQVAVARHGGG